MTEFHEPVPRRWPKVVVDDFAERVADAFSVDAGADLEPLVRDLGGEIIFGFQSLDEQDGGSITVRSVDDFTIILSEITSPKRDRFTVAHELGHLFLHYDPLVAKHGDVQMRATRNKREGDPDHERAEWEANWFAAGFLMPKTEFLEKAGEFSDTDLSAYFNVSLSAVDIRKKTLAIG